MFRNKMPVYIGLSAGAVVLTIIIVAVSIGSRTPVRIFTTDLTEKVAYALTEKYYRCSSEKALNYVTVGDTSEAFKALASKESDIVLSVCPTDEINKKLNNQGIEIEKYIIGKDALVFLNNKLNPVDGVAAEGMRKIYSGQISNWSEVGGEDLKIIAYQTNEKETEQYMLKDFLEGYAVAGPKTRLQNETFEGLMKAITQYLDTRRAALGYTTFRKIKDGDVSEDCRILKLDGIEPNEITVKNNQYPGTVAIYAIIRKDDSQAKRFVEYMLSEKGQTVISDNEN